MQVSKQSSPVRGPSPDMRPLPLSPAPEIPLKDPIDIEWKLNHKLAKQLYEKERERIAKANRDQAKAAKEQEVSAIFKKEQEKVKKMEEALKSMQEE